MSQSRIPSAHHEINDPENVAAGDFVRFVAEIARRRRVSLSERVVAHGVMTIPRVGRLGPTVIRIGEHWI